MRHRLGRSLGVPLTLSLTIINERSVPYLASRFIITRRMPSQKDTEHLLHQKSDAA